MLVWCNIVRIIGGVPQTLCFVGNTCGRSRCPRVIRRCVRPLVCGDRGFESRRGHGCLSFVGVVCRQVEVSATGRSLVQRIPTDCGVSEFYQVQEYISAPQ